MLRRKEVNYTKRHLAEKFVETLKWPEPDDSFWLWAMFPAAAGAATTEALKAQQ